MKLIWKKRSRFSDLTPIGWMMLGAMGALTLVSLVNTMPDEKINYGIKKVTTTSNNVLENVKKNYENMITKTEINEIKENLEDWVDKPKIKKVQGMIKKKNNRDIPAI